MAKDATEHQITRLKAENERLRSENTSLRNKVKTSSSDEKHRLKSFAAVFCIFIAFILLIVGNLLFWTGNTIIKTDRYVDATAPLIKEPAVQEALSTKISEEVFKTVNIDQLTQQALPERAQFIAPTISDQIKSNTDKAIKEILARPAFQDKWNQGQARAHDRFIQSIGQYGSNGSIDISDVYKEVSKDLSDTKLSFLANKPLPDKAGNIQLVSGSWVSVLERTINNIDTWRTIALLAFFTFSVLGIFLSRNRRKAVIVLGSLFAAGMLLTTVTGRLIREVYANKIDPQFTEAFRDSYSVLFHPLAVQTFTLMTAALIVVIAAWLTGPYLSATFIRVKINQLLAGRLHSAIFSRENSLTLWLAKNKRILEWLVVAVIAVLCLFIRLTPGTLIASLGVVLIAVFVIETLSAKSTNL